MPCPVDALVFDVFGTVVDWRSSVAAELKALGESFGLAADWPEFAQRWRDGYIRTTKAVALGEVEGPLNVDKMHRKILDELLSLPRWEHLGQAWSEDVRAKLNLVWHRLSGWPDTVEGLNKLKDLAIIATLSNGNVRLLVDMAKHAGLPWDMVFSTELFDTFKPNPKAYQGAIRHLALPPERCAMVAAHIYDLRAAAEQGMMTVYVRRPDEDMINSATVLSKKDGGEVDYVVNSFTELADILRNQ